MNIAFEIDVFIWMAIECVKWNVIVNDRLWLDNQCHTAMPLNMLRKSCFFCCFFPLFNYYHRLFLKYLLATFLRSIQQTFRRIYVVISIFISNSNQGNLPIMIEIKVNKHVSDDQGHLRQYNQVNSNQMKVVLFYLDEERNK